MDARRGLEESFENAVGFQEKGTVKMDNWVLYEKKTNKAFITFNRPEAMNAMPPSGFQQLAEA